MAITRFEHVEVQTLTFSVNDFGEGITTKTTKFIGRPLVMDVKNSLAITERYRVYQDLIIFKFNYTPWIKDIVDNQQLYAMKWRGSEWRITDTLEANDRMSVNIVCYRSDPETKV